MQDLSTAPYRIKMFINESIHMIWRELKNLERGALQITFYEGSFPIVMQTLAQADNTYVSPSMWRINHGTFKNILEFRDFVYAQKLD